MASHRLFLAAELPDSVLKTLSQKMNELRRDVPRAKWVARDELHVTLVFLGDVASEQIPALCENVQPVCERWAPFSVRIQGLSAFPNLNRPRVFWAGVDQGADLLASLQDELAASLEPLGFVRESRPFHPHVTLARLEANRRQRPEPLRLTPSDLTWTAGCFPITDVKLLRSDLSAPSGKRYSVMASFPLSFTNVTGLRSGFPA